MTLQLNGTNGITYNDGSLQPSAPVGRNLIINGDMSISQRATSAAGLGAASGYFTLDRFKMNINSASAGRFTMSQSAVTDLKGFSNALKIDCTTVDTSIAAGEALFIQQNIEGFNAQSLKNGTSATNSFTLSFYAKSNASRAIASEVRLSSGTNRQASKLHTIGTSWAKYTFTVPAASSTQIDNDNTSQVQINFWLNGGTTFTSGTLSPTLAAATNANRAAGIGSIFASTDNTLEITGVQLEANTTATPFENLQYTTQLQLCQRYYEKSYSIGVASIPPTNTALGAVTLTVNSTINGYMAGSRPFVVSKRAIPTIIIYSPSGSSGTVADGNTTNYKTGTALQTGTAGFSLQNNSGVTYTPVSNLIYFHFIADAEL